MELTLEELLKWAESEGLYIKILGNGMVEIQWPDAEGNYAEPLWSAVSLREALERAKSEGRPEL